MADLDTAAKRKSAVGVGLGFLRAGVTPGGSDLNTVAERRWANYAYVGPASGGGSGTPLRTLRRARARAAAALLVNRRAS